MVTAYAGSIADISQASMRRQAPRLTLEKNRTHAVQSCAWDASVARFL